MTEKTTILPDDAELRCRAEDRLRKRLGKTGGDQASETDTQRLLHELQVHQIELEMQNDELQTARNSMEKLLEKYTDLYDFAPTGYFSMDKRGCILEVNLTGAALLGVNRAELINQCLPRFVAPESRPVFLSFLEQVFARSKRQSCEVTLLRADGTAFWTALHGTASFSLNDPEKWCRVAVSDITALKQADEAQRLLNTISAENKALQHEIIRRQVVEENLKQSEQKTLFLLEQSRGMQEQLQLLSRRVLTVQEEERKRISRELHDEITQTLIGINVHLETLSRDVQIDPKALQKKIAQTQKLVEKSVTIAHRFAQELRPTVLDDLGLIPALHAFMKNFMEETGIRATLKTFSDVEKLNNEKRTAFYRVAQEALTNVARHARASRVDVSIKKLPDAVHMQIKDNGRSFATEKVFHNRLGLLGMRERMEMVGGTLTIDSAPGAGTTVHAQIPTKPDSRSTPVHDL